MNLRPNGQSSSSHGQSGNGTSHGTGRGSILRLSLLIVAVLLVGFLLYRQGSRIFASRVPVLVAASGLEAGTRLGPDDILVRKMQQDEVPAGAVTERDRSAIEGRELGRSIGEGTAFVPADFQTAQAEQVPLAQLIPEGRVLTTVRVLDQALPAGSLKQGDRLAFLRADGDTARVVIDDAWVVGHLSNPRVAQAAKNTNTLFGIDLTPPGSNRNPSPTTSLLLALHPEDVGPLTAASSSALRVVLHGSAEVNSGELLQLDAPVPETHEIELLSGNSRQTLTVGG